MAVGLYMRPNRPDLPGIVRDGARRIAHDPARWTHDDQFTDVM